MEVGPGKLSYRSLDDQTQWWFDGEHSKRPAFLHEGATDLDVLNLWRQGIAVVNAAIAEMDRRGFPLPVKVGEADAS